MIFLTWDEHRPEWGPHTHTKLSLYMKFFGHTKFFVGGVRRITQNSHTRVLEGIFAEDECNVCIYRAMQHTKINEGGIMQASDRWFLKIFFSSRSPKKKNRLRNFHTLFSWIPYFSLRYLESVAFVLVSWLFVYLHDDDFFFEIIMGNFLLRFLNIFFGPIFKLFHAIFG